MLSCKVSGPHLFHLFHLALEQLQEISFSGHIAATARFPDEVPLLKQAGATAVFNIYTEAGAGFANHVEINNSIFEIA